MSELSDLVFRLNKKMEFVLQHAESLKEQLADKDAEITKLRESLRLREEEFIQMQQKVELFETAGVL